MSMLHLHPDALEALRRRRAIVFLSDFQPPELPAYRVSVVACIDTGKFHSALMPADAAPDAETADCEIPCRAVTDPSGPVFGSWEALAVHQLWLQWQGATRDALFELIRAIAAFEQQRAIDAFRATIPAPPSKPPRTRKKATGKGASS